MNLGDARNQGQRERKAKFSHVAPVSPLLQRATVTDFQRDLRILIRVAISDRDTTGNGSRTGGYRLGPCNTAFVRLNSACHTYKSEFISVTTCFGMHYAIFT
jgi:hypothetical protein